MIWAYAKAIAAFVGTVVTALFASGVIPLTGPWQTAATVVSIVATALSTYGVKNRATVDVSDIGKTPGSGAKQGAF